jgi:hypothetical protein
VTTGAGVSTDERKQDAGSDRVAGRAGPPWAVRAAVVLLWVNVGLGALDLVLVSAGVTAGDGSSTATNLVALALGVAVAAVLSVFLWRGARWARWAAGVYLALGIVVNVWGSLSGPALPDLLLYLASAVVLFVTAGLLFNDEGSTRYFARG